MSERVTLPRSSLPLSRSHPGCPGSPPFAPCGAWRRRSPTSESRQGSSTRSSRTTPSPPLCSPRPPCRSRSSLRRSRLRMPPAADAWDSSQPRAAPGTALPGSAVRAGRRGPRGWRRSRARPAGQPRRRQAAVVSPDGRSPLRDCPASPGRRSVRATSRSARARSPRRPRLEISGVDEQARRLRRLRLGLHRPVHDQAEVDDRDLQDHHHEDELPDHRGSIRDAAPGRRGATGLGRPSLSAFEFR
jgi:hypothetical protein